MRRPSSSGAQTPPPPRMTGDGTLACDLGSVEELWAQGVFEFEESLFGRDAAAEAGEGAVGADDAVAGDDDGDAVGTVGSADGSCDGADALGEVVVGNGFGEGDLGEGVPDFLLEGCAGEEEGEVEGSAGAGEVLGELPLGVVQEGDGGGGGFEVGLGFESAGEESGEVVVGFGEAWSGGEFEEAESRPLVWVGRVGDAGEKVADGGGDGAEEDPLYGHGRGYGADT